MTTELDCNSETILDWFNKNLENYIQKRINQL